MKDGTDEEMSLSVPFFQNENKCLVLLCLILIPHKKISLQNSNQSVGADIIRPLLTEDVRYRTARRGRRALQTEGPGHHAGGWYPPVLTELPEVLCGRMISAPTECLSFFN